MCLRRAQPAPPDAPPGGVPFSETLNEVYAHTLQPYHGFVTEKAFTVAVSVAPAWEDVRPMFAPSDADFREDVGVFVGASQKLIKRVMAALTEFDLVDTRKSV